MKVLSFRTITQPAEGIYKESGSKFLAFVYPVTTEAEIRAHIDLLRKKYFDAHHHCYAWMLGAQMSTFRAFDDGEPNHSAGDPILGQIRSRQLTDILIVVVRYFGGIKLGVGGLIQAYKTAAEAALDNATIIEREVVSPIWIRYPYESTSEVMRLVKEFDLVIVNQQFLEICELQAEVQLRFLELFNARMELLIATGHRIFFEALK